MGSRYWRAVLPVAVLVATAVACRQLVGIGDSPPMALGTGESDGGQEAEAAIGVVYGSPACEACLDAQCSAQATACAESPACSVLESCLGACDGDVTCRARCTFEHLTSDPVGPSLEACLFGSCAQPCALGCGSLAEGFGPDAAVGCAACIVANDCSTATACLVNPACLAATGCALSKGHAEDRGQACLDANEAGADTVYAFLDALSSTCVQQCAYGNQWYCVGHYSPAAQTNNMTWMTLSLHDLEKPSTPIEGATVNVCAAEQGLPCDSQWDAGVGEGGLVTVQVPGPSATSHYGPTGFVQIQGNGIDQLYYWAFPLSEPTVSISVPVASQADLQAIASLLSVPIDTNRGVVGFVLVDCDLRGSSGVQMTITPSDSETKIFYLVNGIPTLSVSATDISGIGGAFNVPPGLVTITATPAAIGRPSTVFQGYVGEGGVTGFGLNPNQ
jgi:hypothetical protein